jgi:ribosomal protein L11 methyltransferase
VTLPRERAEIAAAEAFEAGAAGVEERGEGARIELLVYAAAAHADAVRDAVVASAGDAAAITVETLAACDWPETWKEGLAAIAVSPRLSVRPPFATPLGDAARSEIVIEPRQAFGTGAHGSTALALALVDAALANRPGARVLDVGCGSGVLAIAACAIGAQAALACDLDPIAARETRENAARNGVVVASFAGSLDALGPVAGTFDVVVANLISSEVKPILAALVGRVAARGALVLSGLLLAERAEMESLLRGLGLRLVESRELRDERGDAWLGLMASR